MSDLSGRGALVTGAGAGIGAASAQALATAGAAVLVTDVDVDAAEEVAEGIRVAGGRAAAGRLDVSAEDQWTSLLADAPTRLGLPVTVLHNNAAITRGPVMEGDLDVVGIAVETWDAVLAVALRGVMLGCKHTVPGMLKAGGGSIVNTSSVKGSTGSTMRVAYATAKGGVDALTRMVATSYGKHNIRCNAVAPGIVETAGLSATVPAERLTDLQEAHLLRRLGRTEDIAAMVVFLASDEAAFVTGQVIAVDGGLTAHVPALSPPGTR